MSLVHVVNCFLESLLVVTAILSEYTLLFDQWIVLEPFTRFSNTGSIAEKRWFVNTFTALSYALSEPLGYFFLSSSGNGLAFLTIIGSSFVYPLSLAYLDDLLEKLPREEQRSTLEQEPGCDVIRNSGNSLNTAGVDQYSDEQSTDGDSNKSDVGIFDVCEDSSSAEQGSRGRLAGRLSPAQCNRPSWYPFVLALPSSTAAATNAGLLLFVRSLPDTGYLSGTDFGVVGGWTLVFLVLFFYFTVRWFMSLFIPHCSVRRLKLPSGIRLVAIELGTRAALLAMLILVRGIFRVLLGQHFGAIVKAGNGRWLQLAY
ncbi:hypothetical protein D0859_11467 [Hortaea werneckii]|uniref:Uncharacterized protein n=1 Tax=Hortaea werneckii TaxID=91943 RepID=A0A3M7IG65_HORWE|nr:hypothetical protein D0859_11467 [Hortaea werneckii]